MKQFIAVVLLLLLVTSANGDSLTPQRIDLWRVGGALVTLPIPVTGSFSISGGATAAKQDTGNASLASIDSKIPASPATAGNQTTLTAQFSSVFSRIKEHRFFDTEEVRYDIPLTVVSGFIYTGLATAATATSAASWNVVRTSFDANGNPTREQYRAAIVWDNRTTGW